MSWHTQASAISRAKHPGGSLNTVWDQQEKERGWDVRFSFLTKLECDGCRPSHLLHLPNQVVSHATALCSGAGGPAAGNGRAASDAIRALLEGERRDLAEIVLDYEGVPDFHRRVYEIARRIVPGHTRSYGEIAAELGDKGLSRAVGQALGHNPFAPVVPCHRVLAAGGKPGGFSAHGGATAKLRMLMIEGARPPSDTAPLF